MKWSSQLPRSWEHLTKQEIEINYFLLKLGVTQDQDSNSIQSYSHDMMNEVPEAILGK